MVGCLTLHEGPAVSLVTLVPLLVASAESADLSEDLLSEGLEEEEQLLVLPPAREKRILKYKGSLRVSLQQKGSN